MDAIDWCDDNYPTRQKNPNVGHKQTKVTPCQKLTEHSKTKKQVYTNLLLQLAERCSKILLFSFEVKKAGKLGLIFSK